MDVNMPFSGLKKSVCVFYALVISLMASHVASGQGYDDSQYRSNRQSGGIVDRLARGEIPATSRAVQRSDEIRYAPRETQQGSFSTPLRSLDDESVVALRPQAMSVRRASFESGEQVSGFGQPDQTQFRSRQELDRLNAQDHYQSFIERESSEAQQPKADATEMITKIGVNLFFVLALAIGGILIVKQIQKGKLNSKGAPPADLKGLKIDQVLQVTRGVSLYLVDSMASKILVAVDGGGIKSVNVLPSRFEDELEDAEAFSRHRESVASRSGGSDSVRGGSRRGINKTSTSDIDENLIKLLLTKSKEAA